MNNDKMKKLAIEKKLKKLYTEKKKRDAVNKRAAKYFAQFIKKGGMVSYIRDNNDRPTGMVVCWKNSQGVIFVGVSRCNFSAGDRWNKYEGLQFAIGHAVECGQGTQSKFTLNTDKVYSLFDERVRKHVKNILFRAWSYYK